MCWRLYQLWIGDCFMGCHGGANYRETLLLCGSKLQFKLFSIQTRSFSVCQSFHFSNIPNLASTSLCSLLLWTRLVHCCLSPLLAAQTPLTPLFSLCTLFSTVKQLSLTAWFLFFSSDNTTATQLTYACHCSWTTLFLSAERSLLSHNCWQSETKRRIETEL